MFSFNKIADTSRVVAELKKQKTTLEILYFTDKTRGLKIAENDFENEIKEYAKKTSNNYYKLNPDYHWKLSCHDEVQVTFPRFVNYYLAGANSGKSFTIAELCKDYLSKFPKNEIIYASANPLDNDINYEKLKNKIKEIDMSSFDQVIDFTEFKDCLFIFDDCDSEFNVTPQECEINAEFDPNLPAAEIKKIKKLLNPSKSKSIDVGKNIQDSIVSLLFNGRKNNISVAIVGHQYFDGRRQTTIMSQSSGIILFPYNVQPTILKRFLEEKLSFDKADAIDICKLDFFQYDKLFINNQGKRFIISYDMIKIF